MRNTGTIYNGAEKKPVVSPELAGLLPPLTEAQYASLEESILRDGCYSPIIVNENLEIVDGHNRQAICEKHGISYQMMVFHFDDALEAMKWAVETQKARRNLTVWELGKIALKLKPEVEVRAKANLSAGGGDRKSQEARQKDEHPAHEETEEPENAAGSPSQNSAKAVSEHVDTRKQLADSVGISHDTMGRIMKIEEKAPQAVKDALDNREISVNAGYNITREIQKLPEDRRDEAAVIAVADEKMKNANRKADAETDRRSKIAGKFRKAIEKSIVLDPTDENIRCWVECCRKGEREIKNAIDAVHDLSEMFASIERALRGMYPDAAAALDGERRLAEAEGEKMFGRGHDGDNGGNDNEVKNE